VDTWEAEKQFLGEGYATSESAAGSDALAGEMTVKYMISQRFAGLEVPWLFDLYWM